MVVNKINNKVDVVIYVYGENGRNDIVFDFKHNIDELIESNYVTVDVEEYTNRIIIKECEEGENIKNKHALHHNKHKLYIGNKTEFELLKSFSGYYPLRLHKENDKISYVINMDERIEKDDCFIKEDIKKPTNTNSKKSARTESKKPANTDSKKPVNTDSNPEENTNTSNKTEKIFDFYWGNYWNNPDNKAAKESVEELSKKCNKIMSGITNAPEITKAFVENSVKKEVESAFNKLENYNLLVLVCIKTLISLIETQIKNGENEEALISFSEMKNLLKIISLYEDTKTDN